jgi:hypothetical protein
MHGAILIFPRYAFMAWCSVKKKAQGQLYLLPSYFLYIIDVDTHLWQISIAAIIALQVSMFPKIIFLTFS